jgi:uncharacterized protein YggE
MKPIWIAGVAALVLAAAALAGVARPGAASGQETPQTDAHAITVSGLGSVSATPDQAEFSFGVERQARTAQQAFADASAAMTKLVNALKGAGVAAADIQTQHIGISPRYSDDGSDIVGYSASSSVSAKLKSLDRAGVLIDAAVTAGANQVYGPNLSVADRTQRYQQALKNAIADARTKAQALAAASGLTLGKITAASEAGAAPPPMPIAEAAAGRAADLPVEAGTQAIEASVTVTFSAT